MVARLKVARRPKSFEFGRMFRCYVTKERGACAHHLIYGYVLLSHSVNMKPWFALKSALCLSYCLKRLWTHTHTHTHTHAHAHAHTHTHTPAHHPWCVRACCVQSRPDSACLTLLTWVHSFLRWLAAHANTTQPWLAVRATLCPSHNAPGPSPSIDAELASLSRYSDLLPLQS